MSDTKTCAWCGETFTRRNRLGMKLWEKQRYCSKRCAGFGTNPRKPAEEFQSRYRKAHTPDGRLISEHRWVMEQVLGRPLRPDEQVHHKNHNRLDNRPENLEVVSSAEHGKRHTIHPTTKPCVICGQVFTPHKTKRARQQTCSPECRRELLSLRNRERHGTHTVACAKCGTEFRVPPCRAESAQYCSRACSNRRKVA